MVFERQQKSNSLEHCCFHECLKLQELYVLYDDELQERDVRF